MHQTGGERGLTASAQPGIVKGFCEMLLDWKQLRSVAPFWQVQRVIHIQTQNAAQVVGCDGLRWAIEC